MSVLFAFGMMFILSMQFFYPGLLFLDTIIKSRDFEHRIAEWRQLVSQQVIIEWQMLCEINEVRKKYGMEPLPNQAIIEQFKGFGGWTGIRIKIAQSAKMAIQKLTWF